MEYSDSINLCLWKYQDSQCGRKNTDTRSEVKPYSPEYGLEISVWTEKLFFICVQNILYNIYDINIYTHIY